MRRLLVFSAYYEPEKAASLYLSTNLYEAFAENGWQVEVFCPMPTRGVSDEVRQYYQTHKTETKCDGRLVIHRMPLMREGKGAIGRALRYLLMNLKFIRKGRRTAADVLFVQSTPPTQGAMAAIIKKHKHIPLVYNLQDIFPDSLVNTGMTGEGSLLWKIGRKIEKYTYKHSDKIVVISEDFKTNILKKGVPEDKIEVVPNWADNAFVQYVPREDNGLFDDYALDRDKFYVAYSGNIGMTQNMDMLLDAAQELAGRSDIGFLLVGDGAYKAEVEKAVAQRKLVNVHLLPFQDYSRIAEVFSLGNVGLIISKKGVGSNSVPSKTWGYMAAGRPILASFDSDSELCGIVRTVDCGLCVEANDRDGLVRAVTAMADDPQTLLRYGENGNRYVSENLTAAHGTARYIDVVNGVLT